MEKAPISKIVNKQLVSVAPTTKISAALKLIESSNVNLLPVVENGRLVGILNGEKLKASSYSGNILPFIDNPLFVEKSKDADYAIKYMMKHGLSRVPVVESALSMKCIGTISSSELLKIKKNKK